MASDEDLKLSDTLRYYMRDSAAAKNLLYRRLRALANYEAATKNLDKARSKNKDVQAVSDGSRNLIVVRITAVIPKQELQFSVHRIS